MISKEELKNNNIFIALTDQMLEKLVPLARAERFEDRELIFQAGDAVENFYIIRQGTILSEQRISRNIVVTAGSTATGEAFGFSSLLGEGEYSTTTVCSGPCDLIVFNGEALMEQLREDHSMGFLVMQKIVEVLRRRLTRRTDQFLRAMGTHPEIHELDSGQGPD